MAVKFDSKLNEHNGHEWTASNGKQFQVFSIDNDRIRVYYYLNEFEYNEIIKEVTNLIDCYEQKGGFQERDETASIIFWLN